MIKIHESGEWVKLGWITEYKNMNMFKNGLDFGNLNFSH